MTIQAPTRITIEVHPPQNGGAEGGAAAPIVRVVPSPATSTQPVVAEPREDVAAPAAYDPGPCTCLDDADCGADHAND